MAFRELAEGIAKARNEYAFPPNASARFKRLEAFDRLLDGTIYDHLPYPFDVDFKAPGQQNYVRQRDRRPSVKYGLCKIAVDSHASLTFGEAHFPNIRQPKKKTAQASGENGEPKPQGPDITTQAIQALVRALSLPQTMQEAVRRGSIGSVALIAKLTEDGTPKVDVVKGKYCRPFFNTDGDLIRLERIWDVTGEELLAFGYTVDQDDLDRKFWLRVTIDDHAWTWYLPLREDEYARLGKKPVKRGSGARSTIGTTPIPPEPGETPPDEKVQWQHDSDRSGAHDFPGIVPVVWIRNLSTDDAVDGPCTFSLIADAAVALDYELSRVDRGITYSMDPLLVIKTGELGQAAMQLTGQNGITKGSDQSLPLYGEDADAKLLEMTGNGFKESREFIKMLREYSLETVGGMKADQENATGPQSGRALELFLQNVVWFVERIRVSYGDLGLVPLVRIFLSSLKSGKCQLKDDNDYTGVDADAALSIVWPRWWLPRGQDLAQEVTGYETLAGGSPKEPVVVLPRRIVSTLAAQALDLDDAEALAAEADAEHNENIARRQQDALAQAQSRKDAQGGDAGGNGGGADR